MSTQQASLKQQMNRTNSCLLGWRNFTIILGLGNNVFWTGQFCGFLKSWIRLQWTNYDIFFGLIITLYFYQVFYISLETVGWLPKNNQASKSITLVHWIQNEFSRNSSTALGTANFIRKLPFLFKAESRRWNVGY